MDSISQALRFVRETHPEVECRTDEPMKNHTSFKIGGPVRAIFLPRKAEELSALVKALRGFGIKTFVMGNGTNLLADDEPLDMIVIKTSGISVLELTDETEITAGSGVLLSRLAVFACENGLTGLEFAHGIPGTLGGAVSMNAGAYGGEVKDVVIKTEAFIGGDATLTLSGDEHCFAYRKSRFSDTEDIILSSVLKLQKGGKQEIKAKMDDLSARRRESQPLNFPSAGSTFKRPKDGYAASLIDEAGLKGFTVGGAQVSEKHAGFVINRGNASFIDVIDVIDHIQKVVFERFGTELEPEVRILRSC